MADSVSFTMITAPFHAAITERQVKMRRAAMWTVREGGRVVRRAGQAEAPRLTGALRKSIRPGRMRQDGGSWALKVGPRGQRVHLYAGKEEERAAYMDAGYRAVESSMAAIAEAAYARVWKGI